MNQSPYVIIYTDGSCLRNPGAGGWASVLLSPTHKKYKVISNYCSDITTNNRMELTAMIKALQSLKESCRIKVYTDSFYVADPIIKKSLYKWEKNNWKGSRSKIKNDDLWKKILQELKRHEYIQCIHINSHIGIKFNEVCDTEARKQANIAKQLLIKKNLMTV